MSCDTFSFLVTTDNHLGYKHDDHIRRKDSYRAFEEALEIGRNNEVDFIILGGDLFHVNKPSANVEHKAIKIIRKHMNAKVNKEVTIKRVAGHFSHCKRVSHGNFEDPNLTVPYPIFTIHGNHDDPTGPQAQSVCEKLATCGLLNYFGAVDFTRKIHVQPIILQKENIKIALYGMGFVPDYKLKNMFDCNEVTFAKPPRDTYNILVVHQNRVPLNKTKYIPDDYYPTFFHLIVRGHEHASQAPSKIPDSEVDGMVFQPGSTIATSISGLEAGLKQVAIVKVRMNSYPTNVANLFAADYELVQLKRCRTMILKDISQKGLFAYIKNVHQASKMTGPVFKRYSREFVELKINEYLDQFKSQSSYGSYGSSYDPGDRYCGLGVTSLPIVRIRLEYANKAERFDQFDISNKFYPNRVANKDIVLFKKRKILQTADGESQNVTFMNDEDEDEDDEEFDFINLNEEQRGSIDLMIEGYFKDKPKEEQLNALSLNEYVRAVKGSSEDGNVISSVLNRKKQLVLNQFKRLVNKDETTAELYHDTEAVENWFKLEFGKENANIAAGGDAWDDVFECDDM